jgi:hypothetical protein
MGVQTAKATCIVVHSALVFSLFNFTFESTRFDRCESLDRRLARRSFHWYVRGRHATTSVLFVFDLVNVGLLLAQNQHAVLCLGIV